MIVAAPTTSADFEQNARERLLTHLCGRLRQKSEQIFKTF
jgi:hypothetical protein